MEVISWKAAKAAGLKYYFTGKSCKRGHVDFRYVTCRHCVVCSRIYSAQWYQDNPEKGRAVDAKYQSTHPENRRLLNRQRRARKKINGGSHTDVDEAAVLKLQN